MGLQPAHSCPYPAFLLPWGAALLTDVRSRPVPTLPIGTNQICRANATYRQGKRWSRAHISGGAAPRQKEYCMRAVGAHSWDTAPIPTAASSKLCQGHSQRWGFDGVAVSDGVGSSQRGNASSRAAATLCCQHWTEQRSCQDAASFMESEWDMSVGIRLEGVMGAEERST